ncbi:peroxiredoxin [candidate division WOR-3 bacterium]|jgi:peroxiredoxin|nr:peroxiredoxin [candidate division WOR-3 bacterium]
MAIISVGENAPDFVLKDHNNTEFKLSDFEGKRVLLSFHPLAWTSVCAKQMQSLEINKERFDELNTVTVGVNVDPIPSKKAWAGELGIESTRLLSDFWPHGEVAKKFGVFREKEGFSERANIIIDENGKVIFTKVYDINQLPDIEEIIQILLK